MRNDPTICRRCGSWFVRRNPRLGEVLDEIEYVCPTCGARRVRRLPPIEGESPTEVEPVFRSTAREKYDGK